MDPKLAEIYGTNQTTEADQQKLAASELAEELAAGGDVNVDDLTDDQAEALAAEVLGQGEEPTGDEPTDEEPVVSEDPEEDAAISKAAAAVGLDKVAFVTSDRMGRVMAHSFYQEKELVEQEKQAKAGMGKVLGHLKDIASGKQAREGFAAMKKHKGQAQIAKNLGQATDASAKAKKKAGELAGKHIGAAHKAKSHALRGAAKTTGLYGGAAAAAGGAAKAMGGKEKKSSAFDQLVGQRALEILKENGVDTDAVGPEVETETKTASAYEALNQKVDSAAVELLQEMGYEFEAPAEE